MTTSGTRNHASHQPGSTAHAAPASTPASTAPISATGPGAPASAWPATAEASAPRIIWPSPPRLKSPTRNASPMPTPVRITGIAVVSDCASAATEPTDPSSSAEYAFAGDSAAISTNSAPTPSATATASSGAPASDGRGLGARAQPALRPLRGAHRPPPAISRPSSCSSAPSAGDSPAMRPS